MSVKFFIDSNIFLYVFSDIDEDKQVIASKLINNQATISAQVINEVSNNLIKKFNFQENEVKSFIESCYSRYSIINPFL